jgi:transcriptional regulator with XRE-family HTH domain
MVYATDMLKNRITEIRNERGLTVEELAAKAELSPSFVSLLARGKRNISLKNLEKLAAALDCRPEVLIGAETEAMSDITALWAAIPPDRRELAKQVLESFISTSRSSGVDAEVNSGVESVFKNKKNR